MLLSLLLSGYIPPSGGAIDFGLGVLAVSGLLAVILLWQGVRLLRQDRSVGWLAVLGAVALPLLGYSFLMSIF